MRQSATARRQSSGSANQGVGSKGSGALSPAATSPHQAPVRHRVTLILPDGKEINLTVGADEAIWDAALRAGVELPNMCLQGWCISCAGRVLEGEFDQREALRYYDADRSAGFILLCTARPRSAMRILTHQKAAMREHRLAEGLPTPRG